MRQLKPKIEPRTIIWSDITAERVDDSVRLHIQQTEQIDVELWLPIGAALQAATALFELALGHDRARRVQARLEAEWIAREVAEREVVAAGGRAQASVDAFLTEVGEQVMAMIVAEPDLFAQVQLDPYCPRELRGSLEQWAERQGHLAAELQSDIEGVIGNG